MPHGSRIALLSALLLTGCHTAERQPNPLLPRPVINNTPVGDPAKKAVPPAVPTASSAGRANPYTPVVRNENFQRPIAESAVPQPGVVPPAAVPTLPGLSYPPPTPATDLAPMTPPGLSGTAVPPTADGGTGDLKIPTMIGTK